MGSLFVILAVAVWTVVMAAAVVAPMFLSTSRTSTAMGAPDGTPPGMRERPSTSPIRLHTDDRIAA